MPHPRGNPAGVAPMPDWSQFRLVGETVTVEQFEFGPGPVMKVSGASVPDSSNPEPTSVLPLALEA